MLKSAVYEPITQVTGKTFSKANILLISRDQVSNKKPQFVLGFFVDNKIKVNLRLALRWCPILLVTSKGQIVRAPS